MSVRVLVCAGETDAAPVATGIGAGSGRFDVALVHSGCDAMELAYSTAFDAVVVHGGIDGCHGLRVAGAVARKHVGPLLLLVDAAETEEARAGAEARGLDAAQVLPWPDGPAGLHAWLRNIPGADTGEGVDGVVAINGVAPPTVETSTCVRTHDVDAVVLLGSAGTPHMLPALLPRLANTRVPVVVAVHHNPRLSRSFLEWIGEIAETPAEPLSTPGPLPPLTVVAASATAQGLQPNLQSVMRDVLDRVHRPMVVVASGMQLEGVDGVREAVERGGPLLGLHPDACPQPAMLRELYAAGLQPTLCSQAEISKLILQATRTAGDEPVVAANRSSTWWSAG